MIQLELKIDDVLFELSKLDAFV